MWHSSNMFGWPRQVAAKVLLTTFALSVSSWGQRLHGHQPACLVQMYIDSEYAE